MNASGAGYGQLQLGGDEKEGRENIVKLTDIKKHIYMSAHCYLYSPSVLWPEIGFRHFAWAILSFQRSYFYLDRKRKQS
ncbi:unnamed protein product [Prunus armeniaca]|uniref:Uncharacterized protein n=1 Tax=Prunus armeniaca TaxID=36596 RepID=A0A6J5TF13_PRUAR|nr:unnamed protein product [Prunus armeniaca]